MDLRSAAEFAYARLLPWVAPPVLGALIGYVTNDIAIRMLFRPLREWRVFGLRVPFTPGIIPKQRAQLAKSIGRMVAGELITAEAVRRQMSDAGFRSRLERHLTELLASLLDTPLSGLGGPDRDLYSGSLEHFLAGALTGFFTSPGFAHGVRTLITGGLRRLAGLRLGELLSGPQAASFVADRLLPALAEPQNRRRIARGVSGWFQERQRSAEAAGSLLSAPLAIALGELAAGFLPSLLESVFRWLDEEKTRLELSARGKLLLREVLDRLNVLQKFLVTASQFDRRLEQKMPEIVDDTLRALREYACRRETVASLSRAAADALERWRRKPLGEALAGLDPQNVGEAVEGLLAGLEEEGLRRRLGAGVEKWLGADRTLGELLGSWRLGEEELSERAATSVLAYLARRESAAAIAAEVVSFSRRFWAENQEVSLRQLLRLEPALEARAGAYLCGQLLRIVDERLPALLQSFDIESLVVAKVDNLDVAQVEQLLLMVIARQLKWINVFGGILGALIGLTQLLLRALR